MWKDQIVEDLHAIRAAHAADFGYDAQAMYEDIKQREAVSEANGVRFVNLPPRRPAGWTEVGSARRVA